MYHSLNGNVKKYAIYGYVPCFHSALGIKKGKRERKEVDWKTGMRGKGDQQGKRKKRKSSCLQPPETPHQMLYFPPSRFPSGHLILFL